MNSMNGRTDVAKKDSISKWAAPVIILLVLLAGTFWFIQKDDVVPMASDEKPVLNEDYVIEEIPAATLEEIAPSLDYAVQFDVSIPEDAREILQARINDTKELLRGDISVGSYWLELALLYHSAGDYEAAREVWEFMTEVAPDNSIAYGNLGKLHHYQLKDYLKAEGYLLQFKELEPESAVPYFELFDLYRYSYKTDTNKAVETLQEGMRTLPDELSFYLRLGAYYRDTGKREQARSAWLEGLNKARDAGDLDLITAFGSELERLPQ